MASDQTPPPTVDVEQNGRVLEDSALHESAPHESPPHESPRYDAIVVAGGRAKRLGGIDKTALLWQGRTLLDGVLAATAGARRVCVVGSEARLPASVRRAVERPRWGGPAAAIVAGLAELANASAPQEVGTPPGDAEWVLVLAGDLVRAEEAVTCLFSELDRLAVPGATHREPAETSVRRPLDGLISVDAGGRRQPLLAVYRRAALVDAARQGSADNLSVMSLIGGLNLVEIRLPDALADDVDTPTDAARLGIVLPPAAP